MESQTSRNARKFSLYLAIIAFILSKHCTGSTSLFFSDSDTLILESGSSSFFSSLFSSSQIGNNTDQNSTTCQPTDNCGNLGSVLLCVCMFSQVELDRNCSASDFLRIPFELTLSGLNFNEYLTLDSLNTTNLIEYIQLQLLLSFENITTPQVCVQVLQISNTSCGRNGSLTIVLNTYFFVNSSSANAFQIALTANNIINQIETSGTIGIYNLSSSGSSTFNCCSCSLVGYQRCNVDQTACECIPPSVRISSNCWILTDYIITVNISNLTDDSSLDCLISELEAKIASLVSNYPGTPFLLILSQTYTKGNVTTLVYTFKTSFTGSFFIQSIQNLLEAAFSSIIDSCTSDGEGLIEISFTLGDPCDNDPCDPNAKCFVNSISSAFCVCNPGYTGDGYNCTLTACPPYSCKVGESCEVYMNQIICTPDECKQNLRTTYNVILPSVLAGVFGFFIIAGTMIVYAGYRRRRSRNRGDISIPRVRASFIRSGLHSLFGYSE